MDVGCCHCGCSGWQKAGRLTSSGGVRSLICTLCLPSYSNPVGILKEHLFALTVVVGCVRCCVGEDWVCGLQIKDLTPFLDRLSATTFDGHVDPWRLGFGRRGLYITPPPAPDAHTQPIRADTTCRSVRTWLRRAPFAAPPRLLARARPATGFPEREPGYSGRRPRSCQHPW